MVPILQKVSKVVTGQALSFRIARPLATLISRQAAGRRHPQHAVRIHLHCGDAIAGKAVRFGVARKESIAQPVETAPVGTDPEVSVLVLNDRPDIIGREPVMGCKELQVIQPKQPALRAEPQVAGPVLKDGRDFSVQCLRQD